MASPGAAVGSFSRGAGEGGAEGDERGGRLCRWLGPPPPPASPVPLPRDFVAGEDADC